MDLGEELDVGEVEMLTSRSKWADIFEAFQRARKQARSLQEREEQQMNYWLFLFFLSVSIAGFAILLLRR